MEVQQVELREGVAKCLGEALFQVCGGSFPEERERTELWRIAHKSIAFPNKYNDSVDGKPQDVESRLALSLFHRWKRSSSSGVVEIISDLGLTRTIASPQSLAELVVLALEVTVRREGIAHDIRSQPSGVIGIVTVRRSHMLRQVGKLPCPRCIKWCQGPKGLWWHQQQNHKIEHAEAAATAAASTDSLAIIPYDPSHSFQFSSFRDKSSMSKMHGSTDDPLSFVKDGNMAGLKKAVQGGYLPAEEMDHRGASPIMWAAGGGHLEIARFLIEECNCDPSQSQRGKRSFSGRTPLHWAARNGHFPVAQYLIRECHVDLEASTIDGTTAFCWASWQGHLDIMEFLSNEGCDVHCLNSFGCNAVLWCAQGKGDVSTMRWLQSKGCDMTKTNHNGHGVFHKTAQRGHESIAKWFYDTWVQIIQSDQAYRLVGPDTEGYCPSDLAGMEGNEELARRLANLEMTFIDKDPVESARLPSWLTENQEGVSMRISEQELFTWERFGGVRRMRSRLSASPASDKS